MLAIVGPLTPVILPLGQRCPEHPRSLVTLDISITMVISAIAGSVPLTLAILVLGQG